MKILDFYKPCSEPIVVALGFFDSIHIGHIAIINKAKEIAEEIGASSSVFTFENDIDKVLNCDKGLVLTYGERLKKLLKLSVDTVIFTSFTKEFSKLSPHAFFETLTANFKVEAIVCGKDYRFGNKGAGDVVLLKELCDNAGIRLFVHDDVSFNFQRISTTRIKELLSVGDIKAANVLLGDCYSISGTVERGRQVGRQMGFPTANVVIPSDKVKIKSGVYKAHVILDGVKYPCITNYGARPTFNLYEALTETYIDGYSGDLYGREITVYFEEYIRDCVKFDSIQDLTEQLQKDLERIR